MVIPQNGKRISKIDMYLNCAEVFAYRSTCIKRKYGADLYLTGINPEDNSIHRAKPCPLCARTIIQAGIRNVYLRLGEGMDNYVTVPVKELEWVQDV